MRILIVSPKILDDSLSSTSRLATIAHLGASHHVTVLARFRRPRTASVTGAEHVIPVSAPRIPFLNLLWFLLASSARIPSLIKSGGFDVVMVEPASVLPVAIGSSVIRRGLTPPIHLDCRTMPVPGSGWREHLDVPFTALTLDVARKTCSGFSAITAGVAQWLALGVKVSQSDIAVWSTGVDPELFLPRSESDQRKTGPIRFIYHGALNLSRGLATLLEAFALLKDEDSATLTVIGAGTDSSALISMRDRLGLGDIVEILPPVALKEMPRMISSSDCGVIPLPDLPCWSTSSPTKLMEYLSTATPVVLTDIAAHREIACGSGAVVWCESDARDLARAMREAMRDLHSLTKAAHEEREGFVSRFAWEVQVERLNQALAETASRRLPERAGLRR